MSSKADTWLRRIWKPVRAALAVLLFLAGAAALGSWWLWPPQPYAVLPGSDWATCIEFSRDGELVAACAKDDTVLVWETATGRLRREFPCDFSATALLFSPDLRLLAVRGERLKLLDLATGEERPLALANPGVVRAAFSPDGRALLVASLDGTVSLVDVATGAAWSPAADPGAIRPRKADAQKWEVGAITLNWRFSPDGRWLAWEGRDSVRVLDVAARQELAAYPGTLEQLAFAPDGETWAVTAGNDIRLCAAPSGDERAVLRGHTSPVTFLAWSRDGKRLASAADGDPVEVKLWDVGRGQELATLSPDNPTSALRFSPDARFLCLVPGDAVNRRGIPLDAGIAIALWDLSAAPPRHAVSATRTRVLAPRGTVLTMIGEPDVPLQPWTVGRRVRLASWEMGATDDYPAFTPDGKMLILSGNTATVRGKLGTLLARGAGDARGYQYKWVDVNSWKVRTVLDTDSPGVLSPDRRLLAAGGDGTPVKLWRVPPRPPLGPGLVLAGLIVALVVAIVVRLRRQRRRPAPVGPAASG